MRTFQSNNILEVNEDRGYPMDYLLARIRGRRAKLITDWSSLVYEAPEAVQRGGELASRAPEGIWRNLLREYRWAYGQMNGGLRETFGPFFLHAELRTVFIVLRRVGERDAAGAAGLLEESLLSRKVKDALLTSEKMAGAVRTVERIFSTLSDSFGGLARLAVSEGLRAAEQQLTHRYLVHVMTMDLHPALRTFFFRIIDARNILGLYKAIRMHSKTKPAYIPGGGIAENRFSRMLQEADLFTVNALVRKATGVRTDASDITKVESALYRGITTVIRKEGRDPLGEGFILDYLWKRSLEATNLSILVSTRDLEREAVQAELVY